MLQEDADVVLHSLNMADVVTAIPACVPILLIHGTDDELIDQEDAKAFKESRSSIELTLIDGARHAFRGKKQNKELINRVVTWLSSRSPQSSIDITQKISKPKLPSPPPMLAYDPALPLFRTQAGQNSEVSIEVFPRASFSRPASSIASR